MIQITHKDLNNIIDNYYLKIIEYIEKSKKYNLDDINCDLVCYFDKDFEEIIKLKPSEMKLLIKKNIDNDISDYFTKFQDLYHIVRNKFGVWIIENLNIKVCPYCNREYIFKFEDSKKKEARVLATFDHFYSKSKYPFLAISFYNLIPSCHICNSKFKHQINFFNTKHLNPYEDDLNKKAKFHLKIDNQSFIYDKNNFQIELKEIDKNDEATKNTIKTFRLNDLYQNHKDIVFELIQKREIYSDSYIDELAYNYSGLFKNREDLLRLITCGYVEDKDLDKRPLSKLVKDISEELELI